MQLPINLNSSLQTTRWKAILDPVLSNPLNNISVLEGVKLSTGLNVINHKLGRVPEGYSILSISMPVVINQYGPATDKTISLVLNPLSVGVTGDITSGSAEITNVVNMYNVQIGMTVIGVGLPVNGVVTQITGSNKFAISAAASATTAGASITLRAVTTTINLGVF